MAKQWRLTPSISELKSAVGEIHGQDRSVLAVDLNKVLVPPAYNKYVAWGFSDMSLRMGNYDSEKVRLFLCCHRLCVIAECCNNLAIRCSPVIVVCIFYKI